MFLRKAEDQFSKSFLKSGYVFLFPVAVYQGSKSFRGNTLTKGHAFLRMVEEAEKVLGKHLIKTACFSPYSGE